jgi:hypothetical protein
MVTLEGVLVKNDLEFISLNEFCSTASNFAGKHLQSVLTQIIDNKPSAHPLEWIREAFATIGDLFKDFIATTAMAGVKHCGSTGLVVRDA